MIEKIKFFLNFYNSESSLSVDNDEMCMRENNLNYPDILMKTWRGAEYFEINNSEFIFIKADETGALSYRSTHD